MERSFRRLETKARLGYMTSIKDKKTSLPIYLVFAIHLNGEIFQILATFLGIGGEFPSNTQRARISVFDQLTLNVVIHTVRNMTVHILSIQWPARFETELVISRKSCFNGVICYFELYQGVSWPTW